ncbi:SPOR domain-containing protein [uncultured Thioclava sp.]|uniref:SPOR domain-containing protein n=1 Tax=uncultured Thioclava sp. TaxID=473858 RepID=UPI0025F36F91|nr:SPOR domain-containing protein [uncultured Thioclava sp.]
MAAYDDRNGGAYGYGAQAPYQTHPTDPEMAPRNGRAMSRWVNLAGAATSVVMIMGLVVWGYKLAMRDLNGVPVIRAIDGPARIAPEDPGGELARHTGLAVNDVAGTGSAAPAPDRVVLAPAPEGLSNEDLPMGEMTQQIGAADAPMAGPAQQGPSLAASEDALIQAAVALPATEDAPTPQLDIPVEPGAASPEIPELRPQEVALQATPDVIPASVPGVAVSPRPLPKPARDSLLAAALEQAVTRSMSGQAAENKVTDLDPASLSAGTRLVQLGAFDTAADAKAAWDSAAQRFGALMEGKQRVIQKAASGGRDFYRLRVVGFSDVTEARQFCVALQAEQQNCIPTVAR